MHHRSWNTGQSAQTNTNIYKIFQIIIIYYLPTDILILISALMEIFFILHPQQANLPNFPPSSLLTLFFSLGNQICKEPPGFLLPSLAPPFWGYSVLLCDRNLVECSKNTMAEYWGERRGEERSPTGLDKKYWVKPGNIIPGLIGTNER